MHQVNCFTEGGGGCEGLTPEEFKLCKTSKFLKGGSGIETLRYMTFLNPFRILPAPTGALANFL